MHSKMLLYKAVRLEFRKLSLSKPPSKFPSDNFDYDKFKSFYQNETKKDTRLGVLFVWQGQ